MYHAIGSVLCFCLLGASTNIIGLPPRGFTHAIMRNIVHFSGLPKVCTCRICACVIYVLVTFETFCLFAVYTPGEFDSYSDHGAAGKGKETPNS